MMRGALYFIAALLITTPVGRASDIETAPGKEWVNGINLPWIEFGRDFAHEKAKPEKIEEAFAKFEAAGVTSVRIWIHCDGRANPLFDKPGGKVTGLPEGFLKDFEAMLDSAHKHGISVMPALWSFDMVKDQTTVDDCGPYSGIQRNLLLKDDYLDSYIEKALMPMLEKLDAHPALYAWEICNEPEWMVEDFGVPKEAVQRFHARIAAAIHRHGTKPVTTGSAGIKWNSDALPKCVGNWWSDEALQAVFPDKGAYFDFYQVHYYDWMLKDGFDPYAHTPKELGLDKPVMIGEAPGKDSEKYTVEEMLKKAREKGYFGHYFWSYAAHDGHGDWKSIKAGHPRKGSHE